MLLFLGAMTYSKQQVPIIKKIFDGQRKGSVLSVFNERRHGIVVGLVLSFPAVPVRILALVILPNYSFLHQEAPATSKTENYFDF